MAEPVQIAGSDYTGKIRNPLGVVGLTFVTLGIYWFFWYYYLNKELAEMGKARNTDELGTSPGTSVLAVTLGAFILVPPFVSVYRTWDRKCKAEDATGQVGMEAGLGFLLTILISPIGMYILQSNLNKVLQAQATGGSALPPGSPAPPIEQLAAPAGPFEQPSPAAGPVDESSHSRGAGRPAVSSRSAGRPAVPPAEQPQQPPQQ